MKELPDSAPPFTTSRRASLRHIALVLTLLLTFAGSPASAALIVVDTLDDESDDDAGMPGAKCSLREAVTAANSNLPVSGCFAGEGAFLDVIQFEAGLSGTINLGSPLTVTDDLMIDLEENRPLVIAAGSSQILSVDTAFFWIRGLTLQGGSANEGGALLLRDVGTAGNREFRIQRCAFRGNQATDGGAISASVNSGLLEIEDSIFESNAATGDGGALRLFVGDDGGSVRISRTIFRSNSAGDDGGAVSVVPLSPGDATEVGVTMEDVVFKWNGADDYGGALAAVDSYIFLDRVGFDENRAGFNGTIFLFNSDLEMLNSSITRAIAAVSVGGIFGSGLDDDEVTIHHSSFVGNDGRALELPGNSLKTVSSSFFALNGSNSCVDSNGLDFTSGGYNVFDDTPECLDTSLLPTDLVEADPEIQYVGLVDGTWAAVPGGASPPLEHVPQSACKDLAGNPLTVDQRGGERPFHPVLGIDTCDAGAVEWWYFGGPIREDVFDDNFERGDTSEWG